MWRSCLHRLGDITKPASGSVPLSPRSGRFSAQATSLAPQSSCPRSLAAPLGLVDTPTPVPLRVRPRKAPNRVVFREGTISLQGPPGVPPCWGWPAPPTASGPPAASLSCRSDHRQQVSLDRRRQGRPAAHDLGQVGVILPGYTQRVRWGVAGRVYCAFCCAPGFGIAAS